MSEAKGCQTSKHLNPLQTILNVQLTIFLEEIEKGEQFCSLFFYAIVPFGTIYAIPCLKIVAKVVKA